MVSREEDDEVDRVRSSWCWRRTVKREFGRPRVAASVEKGVRPQAWRRAL